MSMRCEVDLFILAWYTPLFLFPGRHANGRRDELEREIARWKGIVQDAADAHLSQAIEEGGNR